MGHRKPSSSYGAPHITRKLFLSAQWTQLGVGVATIVLAPFLMIAFEDTGELFIDILSVLASLYVFLAIVVSRLFYFLNQRQAHKHRSNFALSIIADLEAGNTKPYCLYLRPFLTSRSLRVPNSRFHRTYWPSMDKFYGRRTDLETMFAISLANQKHPLVAIGETGFYLGAGKIITSDDNWRNVFTQLANHAALIIMVPLPRPSTLWEVDYLLDHDPMLEKTLFVMPMRLRSLVPERLDRYWETIRNKMLEKDIRFPKLSSKGGFFFFKDGGATMHMINSGGFDTNYVNQILTGFVNRLRAEEIFLSLPQYLQVVLPKLLEALVYYHPRTIELKGRPISLHALGRSDHVKELAKALSLHGLIAIHRQQNGLQACMEANLHPGILSWSRLKAWAADHYDFLIMKGKLVLATQQAETHRQRMLTNWAPSILRVSEKGCSNTTTNLRLNPNIARHPFFHREALRPEEYIFLQKHKSVNLFK